ncbi:MAG: CapA family protein, partial [Firmicutes bacterium]|nr:CapA family protein [Bacillota bacterium]
MMGEGREQQNQNAGKRRRFGLVLLVMLLAAGALAIPLFVHTGDEPAENGPEAIAEGEVAGEGEAEAEPLPPIELSITCAGDIMAHGTQLTAQYDEATGTYDFSNNYTYVKDYISAADLALCNVETTFAAGKPTGYPAFNSPDSMAA